MRFLVLLLHNDIFTCETHPSLFFFLHRKKYSNLNLGNSAIQRVQTCKRLTDNKTDKLRFFCFVPPPKFDFNLLYNMLF